MDLGMDQGRRKYRIRPALWLITAFMLLTLSAAAAGAAKAEASGVLSGVSWSLAEDGTLTVSGQGEIPDAALREETDASGVREMWYESPWHEYRDSVRRVVLDEGVAAVGDYAFDGFLYLESVLFPQSLERIGYAAFRRTRLTALELPDGVTELGTHAFSGCWLLEKADLGGSLARIGAYAFYQDAALTSVAVPGSLRFAGENAFSGCTGVEQVVFRKVSAAAEWVAIVFENAEANPMAAGGRAYLFDGELLMTALRLSGGSAPVGDYAFYRCQNELTVEAAEDYAGPVGAYAFYQCPGLSEARFGAGVAQVGAYAFAGCAGLTSTGELLSGAVRLMDGAFSGCSSLSAAHLGGGLQEIGTDVFSGCSSLSAVTMDGSLPLIPDRMFADCAALSDIRIPSGVTKIGENAFLRCASVRALEIPETVESIGEGAFQGCTSLSAVRFLGKGPAIGAGAFGVVRADVTCFDGPSWEGKQNNYGGFLTWQPAGGSAADGAVRWTVDEEQRLVFSGSGTVESAAGISDYQGMIREVVLEKGVTGLSRNLLAACLPDGGRVSFYAGLADPVGNGQAGITPERLAGEYDFTVHEDWAEGAFWSLTVDGTLTVGGDGPIPDFDEQTPPWNAVRDRVTALSVAPGVTAVGGGAFRDGKFSGAVSLPDTVRGIGDSAFAGCENLRWIVLPDSVRSIGVGAFPSGLEAIYAPAGSFAARWAEISGVYTADPALPDRLAVLSDMAELSTEDTLDLSGLFRVEPAFRGEDHTVTYTVSGQARLEGSVLIPLEEGQASVRAYLDGQAADGTVNVRIRRPVVSVSLPKEVVLAAGERFPLSDVSWEPADAEADLTWSVSDPSVLRADGNTLLSVPGTDGTFTVTARAWNGVIAQMNVRVYVPDVRKAAFRPVNDVYPVGTELKLVCDVTDQLRSFENGMVVFSSSRPDIIAVDRDGLASFLQSGSAVITAAAENGVSDSVTLTAAVPAERFEIDGPEVIAVGQAPAQLTVSGLIPENADLSVRWTVSDPRIAGLEGSILRPFRAGDVTVRAVNWDGTAAEKTVRIFGKVTSIEIAPVPDILGAGTALQLEVSALSGDMPADPGLLTFVSSDENVARVSGDGLVSLMTGGNAVVTASAGTAEASVTLRVRQPVEDFELPESLTITQYHAVELPVTHLVPENVWQEFSASADEPEVILIDEEGILIGRRPGETYVNVTSWNGVTRSARVAVVPFEAENELRIPSGTGTVRDYSFAGASFEAVTVPAGCTAVGEYAFADCRELVCLFLPDTVRSIADTALSGCDALVCVIAPKGSYAEKWAVRQGIPVFSD